MKAYKIHSTIDYYKINCGDGWNPYGESEKINISDKEFYHFSLDEALKHINSYIEKCAKAGIIIKEGHHYIWSGVRRPKNAPNSNERFYFIKLDEIEINP